MGYWKYFIKTLKAINTDYGSCLYLIRTCMWNSDVCRTELRTKPFRGKTSWGQTNQKFGPNSMNTPLVMVSPLLTSQRASKNNFSCNVFLTIKVT